MNTIRLKNIQTNKNLFSIFIVVRKKKIIFQKLGIKILGMHLRNC